jgi:hypothetical protein
MQQTEGLLPIARNSLAGTCSSSWTGFSISGSGITSNGCTTAPLSGTVTCQFNYYRLTSLGQTLAAILGIASSPTVIATVQASAPHATASFRDPLEPADIVITPSAGSSHSLTLTPRTDGDARLAVEVQMSSGSSLCIDNPLTSVVCALLPGAFVTPNTVSVQFPQLSDPVLQGTKLSSGVLQGHAPPHAFDLLNPAAAGPGNVPPADPHYWFMQNQWYRYTYYAVAPSASAAAAGANITVNGFPSANGNAGDKRFVLAVMGPAVTGQARGPTAAVDQYIEGPNAATTASPRSFAYQVFAVYGNDRIATCPFADGTPTPCD